MCHCPLCGIDMPARADHLSASDATPSIKPVSAPSSCSCDGLACPSRARSLYQLDPLQTVIDGYLVDLTRRDGGRGDLVAVQMNGAYLPVIMRLNFRTYAVDNYRVDRRTKTHLGTIVESGHVIGRVVGEAAR